MEDTSEDEERKELIRKCFKAIREGKEKKQESND